MGDWKSLWEKFDTDFFSYGFFSRADYQEDIPEEDLKKAESILQILSEVDNETEARSIELFYKNSHVDANVFESKITYAGKNISVLIKILDLVKKCNLAECALTVEAYDYIYRYRDDDSFRNIIDPILQDLQRRTQAFLKPEEKVIKKEARAAAVENERNEDKETVKSLVENITALTESARKAEESAKDAKHTADGIMPNVLTTLGVFSAIIIAVVACYLSLLLGQHFTDARPLNLVLCLLMGHILLNVIILLLYLISKLSNYSLACTCSETGEKDCSKRPSEKCNYCRWQNKAWLRYPYMILLNAVFVYAYILLGVWNLLRTYAGDSIDWVFHDVIWLPFFAVACVVFIVIAVSRRLINFVRLKKPPVEASKKEKLLKRVLAKFSRACSQLVNALKATPDSWKKWRAQRKSISRLSAQEAKIEELSKQIEELAEEVRSLRNVPCGSAESAEE